LNPLLTEIFVYRRVFLFKYWRN